MHERLDGLAASLSPCSSSEGAAVARAVAREAPRSWQGQEGAAGCGGEGTCEATRPLVSVMLAVVYSEKGAYGPE